MNKLHSPYVRAGGLLMASSLAAEILAACSGSSDPAAIDSGNPAPAAHHTSSACRVEVLSQAEARRGTLVLGRLSVRGGSPNGFRVFWDQAGDHQPVASDTTHSENGVAQIGYNPYINTVSASHDVIVTARVNGKTEVCSPSITLTAQPGGSYQLITGHEA